MRVAIVGTGYVGLVSGACLADVGHDVTCVDVDPEKVEMINRGSPTIHEPGLVELLATNVGSRLRATTDLVQAVRNSEVTFIAVGTPARNGRIDLAYVEAAASEIGRIIADMPGFHTVVVKSTVIPGTTDGVVRSALERASGRRAGSGFGLGMNPEFLTEGSAVRDFANPDRIVIGGIDERSQRKIADLYASFGMAPKILCNNTTAEFIKYGSNAVLATAISFANELSRLCRAVGNVDVADVMRGVHASSYLTAPQAGGEPVVAGLASFFEAGCGFGGSCLPKDVTALVGQGEDLGVALPLLSAVLEVNRGQPDEMLRLLESHLPQLRGVEVAVLGIAFKPDTDDVRESPAFPVINRLLDRGANVVAYDPIARPVGHPGLRDVRLAESLEDAVGSAEAVLLVTRWPEFGDLADVLDQLGRAPLVVDGRRVLDPARFRRYEGIGRSLVDVGEADR